MNKNLTKNISQWQSELANNGFIVISMQLPDQLKQYIESENYEKIDQLFLNLTANDGDLFHFFSKFLPLKHMEFIISLRESKNEWEEDGIWHDDGSRALAFSLSLTITPPKAGGVLEIRKKGEEISTKITTPKYGDMIIFKTGRDHYEHKINAVTNGKRLIIAGWCYDSKSESSL